MSRLILIDGSAVVYRGYFAFIRNPLINSRGENTGAIFAFINSLTKIINDIKPDYIAVAFDTPKPTFRHKMHADYKSTRAKAPADLVEQFPWIDKVVEGFNIKVIRIEGYEADDIIGTLSEQAAKKGLETLLFSGDKDFFQLVKDNVKILHPRDFEIMDAKGVKAKFGVPPEKVIDTLALMGDTSDNIPGIPGVGPKTAVSLIEEFGDLDTVLKEGPRKRKGKLVELLKEYRDQAYLSQKLVTIDKDCPIKLDLNEIKLQKPSIDLLVPLYRRLEFRNLADKLAAPEAEHLFAKSEDEPASNYRTITDFQELEQILVKMEMHKEIALDTESTSTNAIEASLVGISLSAEEGQAY
jgi:DNA polymerase-1